MLNTSQLRNSAHSTTSPAPRRDPRPLHPRVTTPAASVALFLFPPHNELPPPHTAGCPSPPLSVGPRGLPFPPRTRRPPQLSASVPVFFTAMADEKIMYRTAVGLLPVLPDQST